MKAEKVLAIDAKVIVRMGAEGQRRMYLPLSRAVRFSMRFNRRMERAGLAWRSKVIVQP